MPIQMQCPQCQAKAALPANHAGRPVRCKVCKATFTIPPDAGANPDQPTVIDRYLVRELLGEGSFGSVYRAFDPRLERDVALKVLRPQVMTSAHAVERFLREAKSAGKLLHPNIVPVYDAGRSGSVYYIASAFIKGMTLASAIPEEGGMEPGRAVRLAAQLAAALGYAHQQGILHRDVKPANAMLNEQESLHLMDFGLAGWTQEENTRLTRLGAVMGTPAYMAPEQASGDTKNVGPAADLYSAGVVLYELLTSRLPFKGGHPAALMYMVIHTAPTPPSQHKPDLDAGLEAICLKAMAKKPEDRFASGEEMAAALADWTPSAVAGPTSESRKETILPSSGQPDLTPWEAAAAAAAAAAAGRKPSVFTRETIVPASARRSTLGSPPATPTGTGSQLDRRSNTRRNWMLGGGVLIAVAAVLFLILLGWFPLFSPRTSVKRADSGKTAHTETADVVPSGARAQANLPPAPPPANPPTITVDPTETSDPPTVPLVTVDPPVVPQAVRPPLAGPVVASPPKPQQEAKLVDDVTNGVGMKLKLIKPGKFLMGSPRNETDRSDNDETQHEVQMTRPFYMGAYPVTRSQFETFVNDAGYASDAEETRSRLTWRKPGFAQTNDDPVVFVSWNDAVRFCDWLSEKEKKTYGLPTETQWEYACRAGTTTAYYFGDDPGMLGDYAWYQDNSRSTHPIGLKKPNLWGLYDMHGNVYQWCKDFAYRGGSWHSLAKHCRSANRGWKNSSFRTGNFGFRVVMRPDEPLIAANPTPTPVPVKVDPPVVPRPADKPGNEITNGVGMKLKLIPAGKFLMGSPNGELNRDNNEGPQHEVEITRPFYMGAYPVMRGEFAAFVKDTAYKTEAEASGKGGWGYNATTRRFEGGPNYTWRNPWWYPGITQTDAHPVVQVSWNDATAYCAWLSKKEGETYELPTEAEWEYACRAGTKTRFWCGDADESLKGNANIAEEAAQATWERGPSALVPWNDGYGFTSPVDKFNANPWGLYDMHGNIHQWCADRFGPYQEGAIKDPKGNDQGNSRVIRGGSWFDHPQQSRSAKRGSCDAGGRYGDLGFRVVFRVPARNP